MSSKEVEAFLQGIKGPAAGILWALALTGRRLLNREMNALTGYSKVPLATALALLERAGYVESLGRGKGWALGPGFFALFRPAPVGGEEGGDRPFLILDPDVVVDLDLFKEDRSYQQQQRERAEDEKVVLNALLAEMGIRGRAYFALRSQDLKVTLVRGWWWYALAQSWLENPAGYVITRLLEGHEPPAGFLTLARLWPKVCQAEREQVAAAARGVVDYRQVAGQAQSGEELRERLAEEFHPGLDAAALQAYLDLVKIAPERLSTAGMNDHDQSASGVAQSSAKRH